jgi:translation elongation factor EF-1alpha
MDTKINFVILGNGDYSSKIIPSKFFCISGCIPKLNKRVVLGKVESGPIAVGDPITFSILTDSSKTISDHIKKIEIQHKSVTCAVQNEFVGIQLSKTTIKQLRQFNGK